jgi:alkylation response protein AidB-like acyl-CoA dehydrogenase
MMQALGHYALPFRQARRSMPRSRRRRQPRPGYCNLRKLSIFGGSNEIQKNIISQMIMGL